MVNIASLTSLSLVDFSVAAWVEKVNELCLTHETRLTQSPCCELYSIQES